MVTFYLNACRFFTKMAPNPLPSCSRPFWTPFFRTRTVPEPPNASRLSKTEHGLGENAIFLTISKTKFEIQQKTTEIPCVKVTKELIFHRCRCPQRKTDYEFLKQQTNCKFHVFWYTRNTNRWKIWQFLQVPALFSTTCRRLGVLGPF